MQGPRAKQKPLLSLCNFRQVMLSAIADRVYDLSWIQQAPAEHPSPRLRSPTHFQASEAPSDRSSVAPQAIACCFEKMVRKHGFPGLLFVLMSCKRLIERLIAHPQWTIAVVIPSLVVKSSHHFLFLAPIRTTTSNDLSL